MKARTHGAEGNDDVQCILKWMRRKQANTFSLRELTRDLSKTFSGRALALGEALKWLIQKNCIKPVCPSTSWTKKGPGRSRSLSYRVNPNLFDSPSSQDCDDFPSLASDESLPGDFVNFATDTDPFDSEEACDALQIG